MRNLFSGASSFYDAMINWHLLMVFINYMSWPICLAWYDPTCLDNRNDKLQYYCQPFLVKYVLEVGRSLMILSGMFLVAEETIILC